VSHSFGKFSRANRKKPQKKGRATNRAFKGYCKRTEA
jgi:hypothetical protein